MTLFAVINPFQVLVMFNKMLADQPDAVQRTIARQSCTYAFLLIIFFLVFGTFLLKAFGVNLSTIRIVGGIVLTHIGFQLFMPANDDDVQRYSLRLNRTDEEGLPDIAFFPMTMPYIFGPGSMATIMGMTSSVRDPFEHPLSILMIALAGAATMALTYLFMIYAGKLYVKLGRAGVDAITRIMGVFVSAIGIGMILQGVVAVFKQAGFGG